jgi:hypothetical protein
MTKRSSPIEKVSSLIIHLYASNNILNEGNLANVVNSEGVFGIKYLENGSSNGEGYQKIILWMMKLLKIPKMELLAVRELSKIPKIGRWVMKSYMLGNCWGIIDTSVGNPGGGI